MANRYWVGGNASWDGTAGTKWALTSGGEGGQSVPTTADDVFFTNLSTGPCTVAAGNTGAKSITCTGFTGTLNVTSSITVAGSITLVAGMTYTPSFGSETVTVSATGTITSAGKSFHRLTIDAPGGTVQLADAINCGTGGTLSVLAGTFTTNNFSITAFAFLAFSSNIRTINLGSSTVTVSGVSGSTAWNTAGTSLTLNAGTSTINCTGVNPTFSMGPVTLNNVTFSSSASTNFLMMNGTGCTISTLTFTAPAPVGVTQIVWDGNPTIGTLVASGASVIRRLFFAANTIGFPATLTITNWATISDVDFRDITLNTSRSGTRLGNCGGNTNITFAAAKTVYWNLAGNQNWSATGWATSSGGAPSVNNFPLAQDTAVFDNAGSITYLTIDAGWNLGTMDMSARTTAMTLAGTGALIVYGNWLNGTGTTVSISSSIQFKGRTTQTITCNGRTFTCQVQCSGFNNNVVLADAFISSALFAVEATTGLILSNNTLTASQFTNQSTGIRTLAFGTGNITVTGIGAFNIFSNSLTVTGTPVVNLTYSGAVAVSVSTGTLNEANSISFNFTAGTYSLTFLGSSNTAKDVNFTGFAGTWATFTTPIIYGNLTVSAGMTIASSASTVNFRATSGIKTITSNGKTFNFPITFNGVGGTWQLQDNLTQGSTRLVTLTNGTLDLNGKTHSASNFATATGTKNLTFNGGTLVLSAGTTTAFNNAVPTNFTTTAGAGVGKISLTSAAAKTFVGSGSIFNCTLDQGGVGTLTISGSNTFNDISNTYAATGATSILFTAGTTNTFSNWSASGQATRLLTIGSAVAAGSHTLSKSTGTVSADYLSLSYSTATGGATWYAGANSTNGGNNTGWLFSAAPTASGNFLAFFV